MWNGVKHVMHTELAILGLYLLLYN